MIVIDSPSFLHDPVLAAEVVGCFADVAPGTVVDGTLGGGGHTAALLRSRSDLTVVGVDRDRRAREAAERNLRGFGDRVRITSGTFDEGIDDAARAGGVVGVLLDLGVSSPQIDEAERGFSYARSGPLDMRMDTEAGPTAAELLSHLDVDTLARHLRELADEPHAGRVARAVLDAPLPTTTGELADRVRAAVPGREQRRGDPSKRTFQALRILVNDELGLLDRGLDAAIDGLRPGGVLAVISYHSGEDRLVKDRFRRLSEPHRSLPRHLPVPDGLRPVLEVITRKAIVATPGERQRNPRASSARLRAARRTDAPFDRSAP